ncbi:hypothetical protein [Propionivibrio limicola]|uniref:hypothetical protein n=1 Tax=Propionivibrio limicola TaxID=167645 RepID=UPI001290B7DC|nr:hypothetical protein [Propionivibrio limicola]
MRTYLNKKNGKRYIVLADGIDCTNERDGTAVVIYAPEDKPELICVREKTEFMKKFDFESDNHSPSITLGRE